MPKTSRKNSRPENVTCDKCGLVSFPVTKQEAEEEVAAFIEMYRERRALGPTIWDKVNDDGSITESSMPSVKDYRCLRCSGEKFHPSTEADMKRAFGCTINPVIYE